MVLRPIDSDILRVMVDANILVAGIGWPRFPYEVLRHAVLSNYRLVLSPFVIDEAREHIARLFPNTLEKFEAFLEACNYEAVPTPTLEELAAHSDLVRDIKDIPVALAAINARVACLVSQDKDLTAQDDSTKTLREHLTVVLPGTFLRQYMGWSSEALEAIRDRTWKDVTEQ